MAYPQTRFAQTTISSDSIIGRRRRTVSSVTLLHQLDVLKSTGRYDAFRLQWHESYADPPMVWPVPNHLFWDSDVAKWIEGACYFLMQEPNQTIDAAVGELVEMIRSAQQPDGYLNIHYTVVEPGKRFTNLRDFHELYNAGHLIEAALAHHDLYHNDLFLGPICKYVDLLCDLFGPEEGQVPGYPGHPEIELALLRLYQRTGQKRYLHLVRFFLTERGNPTGGNGKHFFDMEREKREEDPNQRPAYWPSQRCLWYYQAHAPIAEQESIEGHSVRAMYLLTAAADLLRVDATSAGNGFERAVFRLWQNMVDRKMYLTGGIGSMKQFEGFGIDYFLPQGSDEGGCYSETCAAIGVMMFAERLLQIRPNGRFADIMELSLYNTVLTSMSWDGKQFTYVNQLASSDADKSQREEWFTCACCPPNVLRILGQIGGYIWSYESQSTVSALSITANLYVSSTLELEDAGHSVALTQESNWPWEGNIKFSLKTDHPNVQLRLRIPEWANGFSITPTCPGATVADGYLTLGAEWLASNASFSLSIPLDVRLVSPHPFTNQHTITLMRGPIAYCVEDVDNPWVEDHFKSVYIDPKCKIIEQKIKHVESGDSFVGLTIEDGAWVRHMSRFGSGPFVDAKNVERERAHASAISKLSFIPYYFRANRGGKGHMRVGLRSA